MTTDDGLEMDDTLPDWRSTCSSLLLRELKLSASPQQPGVKVEVEVEAKYDDSVALEDRLPAVAHEDSAPLQFSLLPPSLMSKIQLTEKMYTAEALSSIIIRPSCSVDSLDDFSFRQPSKVRKHSVVKRSLSKIKKSVLKKVKSIFPGSRRRV